MKRSWIRFYDSCITPRTAPGARCLHTGRQWLQQHTTASQPEPSTKATRKLRLREYGYNQKAFYSRDSEQDSRSIPFRKFRKVLKEYEYAAPDPKAIGLFVDSKPEKFSALLLRDLCHCPSCVDPSTKQKLFSTADIPATITARAFAQTEGGVSILWDQDVPGYDRGHRTEIGLKTLRSLLETGFSQLPLDLGPQDLWDANAFNSIPDIDYQAYMQDDSVLHGALRQLHTHGLLFLSNVPDSASSVSTIGERIGPIKNTFYGYTWDVRSVPEAKNVAYTSQDLGFHMDLLYTKQPPHIQLLHCIRSSTQGGASLFTDSHRAAQELFAADAEAFNTLSKVDVTFHYNHPSANLYRQLRPVFELQPLRVKGKTYTRVSRMVQDLNGPEALSSFDITPYLESVAWSPPFQGPFSALRSPDPEMTSPPLSLLGSKLQNWHAAAQQFSALIHRPDAIYERMMRPGECVIFDNRRVLHARRAFDVSDAGTERWLRGAYLDKDPYLSKLHVLQRKLVREKEKGIRRDGEQVPVSAEYFEAASAA